MFFGKDGRDRQEPRTIRVESFLLCVSLQVGKILYSFATAFRRVPKSPSSQSELSQSADAMTFHFDVSLEFKEDDGKGNFSTVPKDKNVFKLRKDVEKKLCISVTQVTNNKELKIERLVLSLFQYFLVGASVGDDTYSAQTHASRQYTQLSAEFTGPQGSRCQCSPPNFAVVSNASAGCCAQLELGL